MNEIARNVISEKSLLQASLRLKLFLTWSFPFTGVSLEQKCPGTHRRILHSQSIATLNMMNNRDKSMKLQRNVHKQQRNRNQEEETSRDTIFWPLQELFASVSNIEASEILLPIKHISSVCLPLWHFLQLSIYNNFHHQQCHKKFRSISIAAVHYYQGGCLLNPQPQNTKEKESQNCPS